MFPSESDELKQPTRYRISKSAPSHANTEPFLGLLSTDFLKSTVCCCRQLTLEVHKKTISDVLKEFCNTCNNC